MALIRMATLADFPSLISMVFDYLTEFEGAQLDDGKKQAVRNSVFLALQQQKMLIAVAQRERHGKVQLVGYGVADVRPDIFGQLVGWGHHLFVAPKWRSKENIAAELIKFGEAEAVRRGAIQFFIDTPRPKFFKEKLGYKDLYQVVVKPLQAGGKDVE
jgi:hypothetical protein